MILGLSDHEWEELKEQQREYNIKLAGIIERMEPGEPGQILSTDEEGKPKWIDCD